MMDGMFAFAIADGDDIYLARDPVGIKPLYYGKRSGSTIFASELKALAGVAENVREFPPGHWFHSQSGFHQYYDVPNLDPLKSSDEEHAARVRQVLERSVVKRLMSDVPLGSFLSGGLDSSAAASIASRHIDGLNTFAVGIEGSRDLEAARVAAKFIGSKHHEYLVTMKEVASCLPEIVYSLESFDMDLVRSAVPCYFASRLAAEYVKVIFTGEGADELFAGYTYQKDITDKAALRAELRRSIQGLHNTNLQRVDRLTMAHGIEARVPFLDVKMIEEAQKVPARLQLRDGIEKWVLRKACEDLLPSAILWRKKEQFDEGSGVGTRRGELPTDREQQTVHRGLQAPLARESRRRPTAVGQCSQPREGSDDVGSGPAVVAQETVGTLEQVVDVRTLDANLSRIAPVVRVGRPEQRAPVPRNEKDDTRVVVGADHQRVLAIERGQDQMNTLG